MGDVIHNLPVVTDLVRAFPGITIDWVTEAPYTPLVALHPGVTRVLPVRLRAVKKKWWTPQAWHELADDRARIRETKYDLAIDTQGLIKSALVARWARCPIAGYDRSVAREPAAARAYQQRFVVPRDQHAVERNRQLAGMALGYTPAVAVDYGIQAQTARHQPHQQAMVARTLGATGRAFAGEWRPKHVAVGKRSRARAE
jgi:heptosyltransferase I